MKLKKTNYSQKLKIHHLSSSNLELAIDKALTLSESLEKIWTEGRFKTTTKTAKFSVSIRIGLRQVKRPSSNPKSERYFWLNSHFIEGNLKHKKRRTDSCESILRFVTPAGFKPATLRAEI